MRNTLIFSILVLLSGVVACKQGQSEPKEFTTPNGNKVINYTNNPGERIKPGDAVYVVVDTYVGDSTMGSTRKAPDGPIKRYVFPTELTDGRKMPTLFDAAPFATKGDSFVIIEKIDSARLQFLPPALKGQTEVRYCVAVRDVKSKAEVEKEMAAEKAEADQKRAQAEADMPKYQARFGPMQTKMNNVAADYKAGKLNGKITSTASGLKMIVEDQGSGAKLKTGEKIAVHYYGMLTNGTMFDNSFQRGMPLEFPLGTGQMIKGFDEGAALLNHGGKAILFLPPALGYGDNVPPGGPIPAGSELIFYVEVL